MEHYFTVVLFDFQTELTVLRPCHYLGRDYKGFTKTCCNSGSEMVQTELTVLRPCHYLGRDYKGFTKTCCNSGSEMVKD